MWALRAWPDVVDGPNFGLAVAQLFPVSLDIDIPPTSDPERKVILCAASGTGGLSSGHARITNTAGLTFAAAAYDHYFDTVGGPYVLRSGSVQVQVEGTDTAIYVADYPPEGVSGQLTLQVGADVPGDIVFPFVGIALFAASRAGSGPPLAYDLLSSAFFEYNDRFGPFTPAASNPASPGESSGYFSDPWLRRFYAPWARGMTDSTPGVGLFYTWELGAWDPSIHGQPLYPSGSSASGASLSALTLSTPVITRLPNLRRRPRDDVLRTVHQPRNAPTSRQANLLRRGPRNTYR